MGSEPDARFGAGTPGAESRTYLYERLRAVFGGVLETAASTYLLFVAVRHCHAGELAKGLLASSLSGGLLLSPLAVHTTAKLRLSPTAAAAWLFAAASAGMALAAAWPTTWGLLLGGGAALLLGAAAIPLLTQMYQENYPQGDRGRLFSHAVSIRVVSAALFSLGAGWLLGDDASGARWLLLVFSGAAAGSSWCISRIPSVPMAPQAGSHPLSALRVINQDPRFRHTLACWMLMGFGNLMMNPLRVEYLASPRHGVCLDATSVSLLMIVVPNAVRLLMAPFWGGRFDRMDFFAFRVVLNLSFASAIGAFFLQGGWPGWIAGSVLYGVAFAGGDIAWNLWVTKFAPPGLTADYMAAHTFLTGIRGVLAPVTAFQIAAHWPLHYAALFATGLVVLSAVLLLPEIGTPVQAPAARELSEQDSLAGDGQPR